MDCDRDRGLTGGTPQVRLSQKLTYRRGNRDVRFVPKAEVERYAADARFVAI